tara:strand:- start:515 stop:1135 length:621 start_codon:yes stop_codon:yes gene_type:complete
MSLARELLNRFKAGKSRYHKRHFARRLLKSARACICQSAALLMPENLRFMTENDYLLAWGAYLVAALGCLLVWFRLTGWMWRYVREPLRVLVLVLLFSPTIVDPGKDQFAPAIAITAMDLLLDVGNNAWRAVADLSMYGLIAFVLYLLFVVIRWPVERWWQARKGPAPIADDEPTLREMMARDTDNPEDTRYDARGDRRMRVEPRL